MLRRIRRERQEGRKKKPKTKLWVIVIVNLVFMDELIHKNEYGYRYHSGDKNFESTI